MCTGIDECPICSESYTDKTTTDTHIILSCSNKHEWIVHDADNIGEFFPDITTPA